MVTVLDYRPPPTIKAFIKDFRKEELFYSWIVGPVGCIAPETLVHTDRGLIPIAQVTARDRVLSLNATTGRYQLSPCGGGFLKGKDYLFRVTTRQGEFDAAEHHLLLCADGRYRRVSELRVGDAVETYSPDQHGTTEEHVRSASRAHAPHWMRTAVDWLGRYAGAAHLYGQRLLAAEGGDLALAPLLADVRASVADELIGTRSRQRRLFDPLETDGSGLLRQRPPVAGEDRGAASAYGRGEGSAQTSEQSPWMTEHRRKNLQSDRGVTSSYSITDRTILSIERRDVEQEFWDIQVLDTNNYVTVDGCVHHNSGKTTGIFFKLVYMASMQAPSPDGIRRTRAVIVRNTLPMLKDTTLVSWNYWFKDGQAGEWKATDKTFMLRFADVECEVMFRPLDTPDDVRRVLSLEINFALIDEFVEIPKAIVDALSARLGRYKQPDGTPVTVWGMWGSSNPSTEDNWWYDYLHSPSCRFYKNGAIQPARGASGGLFMDDEPSSFDTNATYFHQPSALTPQAENIENLPGKRAYYTNAAKGKGSVWIKQFVEAEWGFSVSGQAVISSFRTHLHVSPYQLVPSPYFPLVVGTDPGIAGSALILGQMDFDGRVKVFAELVQQGMGADRIIAERLKPMLRSRFPMVRKVIIALDPAGASRTQTDASSVKKIFSEHFEVDCETNNRLPLRINAYDHYCNTLVGGEPALQIDPVHCPILIRALKGGWRYGADVKKDILKGSEPEKNPYSHPGDAGGYLLRFFHRDGLKEKKYGMAVGTLSTRRMRAPQLPGYSGSYHAR